MNGMTNTFAEEIIKIDAAKKLIRRLMFITRKKINNSNPGRISKILLFRKYRSILFPVNK